MRSTITLSTLLAAAAVASVSAETNCNPTYDVPTSGECFTGCNVKAGAKFLPNGFTMDSASPYFLDSLKLMCTKGTSEYTAFMTQAGMCMTGCKDDPMLFADEFAAACTWYAEHKNDECVTGSTNTNTTTTPTGSSTTTTIPDATETNTTTATEDAAASTELTNTESVNTDTNLAAESSAANKL